MPKKIIAVSNHKGGVGKSEVTRNLAVHLAKRGNTVLVVDLDDQGNLSEHFGFDIEDISKPCITDVLLGKGNEKLSMDDIILNVKELLEDYKMRFMLDGLVEDVLSNIYLAPCNLTFDDASPLNLRTRSLKFELEAMKQDFDYIILDCPPNLKIVTENAFLAADNVIVPVEAGTPYITGITRTKEAITSCSEAEHVKTAEWKILLNVVKKNTIRDEMGIEEVIETFGTKRLYETRIPDSVKVGECRQINEVVSLYYPDIAVSKAFDRFTEEIING